MAPELATSPAPSGSLGLEDERDFLLCLKPEELAALAVSPEGDAGIDLVLSSPGRLQTEGFELKSRVDAVRDLHAEILRLARHVDRTPELTRAWLLVRRTKLTAERLSDEWRGVLAVLRPKVAARLAASALCAHGVWSSEPLTHGGVVERWVQSCLARPAQAIESSSAQVSSVPTPKYFEVWKVLLSAWLGKEGPLPIRTVMQRSGATHPTVAAALKRLEHRGEVRRGTDRAVELRGWPRATYLELEPLLPALRKTVWFVDRSGRGADPEELLRRLTKAVPPQVALGGVYAAKQLDPEFDLLGVPRVDLTVHDVNGGVDFAFIKKVDPALERSDTARGAVLAIHQLTRREPLFAVRDTGLPLVDPAEVVLDLAELRLSQQLDELVARLRNRP